MAAQCRRDKGGSSLTVTSIHGRPALQVEGDRRRNAGCECQTEKAAERGRGVQSAVPGHVGDNLLTVDCGRKNRNREHVSRGDQGRCDRWPIRMVSTGADGGGVQPCRSLLGPRPPGQIVEVDVRAVVHAGAQVHEAAGPLDQCGQDVGREHVDGKDVGEAVLRLDALRLAVAPDAFWRPGFKSMPRASVQNAWMCSQALFHDRGMVRLEELAKSSILIQGNRSGSGLVFGKWLEECGVTLPRLITSNSLVALIGLTIAAIGISYLPQRCFEGLIEQGKLRSVETDPPLPAVTYVAMFRGDESGNVISAISSIAHATCDFSHPIRWA